MDSEQYLEKYARVTDTTVAQLRIWGLTAYLCRCGQYRCDGWRIGAGRRHGLSSAKMESIREDVRGER